MAGEGSTAASTAAEAPLWRVLVLGALAGGLGWGIRGQYGHETGAMLAGLLVGLVLAGQLCARFEAAAVVRAVAWMTIAIGFGGSMTYGQTVGLTHDVSFVGNWAALRWGMLGLALKGGIWIGFAGVFLGMGLGGVRYSARWMTLSWLGLLVLCAAGLWIFNEPFDPANRVLPHLYFSADWRWNPGAVLKPRREVWGGLGLALIGWLAWVRWRMGDLLAFRLGLWGILGGALGFPLGQSLQAYHAWNLESFRTGRWAEIDPWINWWNFMETTYGLILGAMIGLGLWWNRRLMAPPPSAGTPEFPPWLEWGLILVHTGLLVTVEFLSVRWVDALYDFGLWLGFIPLIGIAGGRWWPYLLVLPITAIPYLGKTLRQLVHTEAALSPVWGWIVYGILPFALVSWLALRWSAADRRTLPAAAFLRPVLLTVTWLYFGLNFAFFHYPWPWSTWTARTPNSLVYWVCALALTAAALSRPRRV